MLQDFLGNVMNVIKTVRAYVKRKLFMWKYGKEPLKQRVRWQMGNLNHEIYHEWAGEIDGAARRMNYRGDLYSDVKHRYIGMFGRENRYEQVNQLLSHKYHGVWQGRARWNW